MDVNFNADEYRTSVAGAGVPARLPWFPRLSFGFLTVRACFASHRSIRRGEYTNEVYREHSLRVFKALERSGGKITVTGLDGFRSFAGPCIVIGNHMSLLETFLVPGIVPSCKSVSFVVKDSLAHHFLLGPIVAAVRDIPVTRSNPRQDLRTVFTAGKDRLGEGRSLCIFPQSTRHVTFSYANFNSIGAKLAYREGVPVVPLALKTDILGNGRLIKDLGPFQPENEVRFAFGPPIAPGPPAKAVQQTVVEFITGKLGEWGVSCVD